MQKLRRLQNSTYWLGKPYVTYGNIKLRAVTRIATTESVSLPADEKLTAFMELEAALIRTGAM